MGSKYSKNPTVGDLLINGRGFWVNRGDIIVDDGKVYMACYRGPIVTSLYPGPNMEITTAKFKSVLAFHIKDDLPLYFPHPDECIKIRESNYGGIITIFAVPGNFNGCKYNDYSASIQYIIDVVCEKMKVLERMPADIIEQCDGAYKKFYKQIISFKNFLKKEWMESLEFKCMMLAAV